MNLIFEKETYTVRGAVFEVYKEMGCGFLESVYQECLKKEFVKRNIPFVEQAVIKLFYKGEELEHTFKPDFICYGGIVLELKAVSEICGAHKAQLLNYLKATGMKLGLLINFGSHPKVQIERYAL